MERCRHVTLILRKMDQSVLPASWRALDNSPSGEKIHPVRFSRSLMRGGCPSSTPPAEQTPSVEGPCPLAEVQVVAIHPQPHAAKQEIAPPSLWGLGPNRALSEGAFFVFSSSKASHLQNSAFWPCNPVWRLPNPATRKNGARLNMPGNLQKVGRATCSPPCSSASRGRHDPSCPTWHL